MTFLPALLVIVGRKPFWPYVPHVGDTGTDSTHGAWRRIGERVARTPTRVLVGTTGLLVVMAFGLLNLSGGLTQPTRSATRSSRSRARSWSPTRSRRAPARRPT